MSREGQFFLHGEDAHANSASLFRNGVPGKNKGSFGEIHFPRQRLHLLGTETASVEKNRQRVASEGPVGKYIDLHHRQLSYRSRHAFRFYRAPYSRAPTHIHTPDAIP